MDEFDDDDDLFEPLDEAGLDTVACPYCGELIEVVLDPSVEHQSYIEDCSVCCRPIVFDVTAGDGVVTSVSVRGEDD